MGKNDQGTAELKGRYLAVPRTLCFVTYEDQVLLLHGAPDKRIWPNRYNGVGGHVEVSEDVRSAMLREIREEAGISVTDLQLRGVVNVTLGAEATGVILFVFTARALSPTVQTSAEGRPVWVRQIDLDTLDLVDDLPLLLPRVLAMKPHDLPFFAHYTYDEAGRLQATFASE